MLVVMRAVEIFMAVKHFINVSRPTVLGVQISQCGTIQDSSAARFQHLLVVAHE